jgi:hypothetical protein
MSLMNERVRRWVLLPALGLGLASAPRVAAQDTGPLLPEAAPSEAAAPEATAPSVARPVPAAFNSPAATLRTFLEAMAEPPDEPRAVECMDISLVGEDVAWRSGSTRPPVTWRTRTGRSGSGA